MKTAEEKNELAQKAMPRVNRIINSMLKRLGPDVDRDEIRSFALDGLAQAIEKYDPSLNVSISTFATRRVEGEILDGLSQNHMLPRRLLRQIAFIKKSQEMMRCEQQVPPPKDKVEAVHRLSNRLKELAGIYITSCSTEADQQMASESILEPEAVVEKKQYYSKLNDAIATLSERQQLLIQQYFYEDLTLDQVAENFGKSRSWACRNLQTALRLTREYFQLLDAPSSPSG
ncbi:MAG: sigma-70 family RNA polymerase sigma factor [Deltaproteobacteria bacterium]|nr:sigma-70 family RNA polymerase sigma factor [Deltaproteobacteria bacterium]